MSDPPPPPRARGSRARTHLDAGWRPTGADLRVGRDSADAGRAASDSPSGRRQPRAVGPASTKTHTDSPSARSRGVWLDDGLLAKTRA
eukprot:scaffold2975_cov309-Prasinococcus_capsulatus_cf.AAC.1